MGPLPLSAGRAEEPWTPPHDPRRQPRIGRSTILDNLSSFATYGIASYVLGWPAIPVTVGASASAALQTQTCLVARAVQERDKGLLHCPPRFVSEYICRPPSSVSYAPSSEDPTRRTSSPRWRITAPHSFHFPPRAQHSLETVGPNMSYRRYQTRSSPSCSASSHEDPVAYSADSFFAPEYAPQDISNCRPGMSEYTISPRCSFPLYCTLTPSWQNEVPHFNPRSRFTVMRHCRADSMSMPVPCTHSLLRLWVSATRPSPVCRLLLRWAAHHCRWQKELTMALAPTRDHAKTSGMRTPSVASRVHVRAASD